MNKPAPQNLKLIAILAHPDDESWGLGSTLARYAAEGVETSLITATRGERGFYGPPESHPGFAVLGAQREAELRRAAALLGVRQVHFLDYIDGDLDQADPREAVRKIVRILRQVRPQVALTFSPDGDYGHPDHIAVSQLAAAALVAATDPSFEPESGPPHRTDKFYYVVSGESLATSLNEAIGELGIEVNGQQRQLVAWPEWAITTRIQADGLLPVVQQAALAHRSQLPGLPGIESLSEAQWRSIFGENAFVRVFCLVNSGSLPETDLFAGLR